MSTFAEQVLAIYLALPRDTGLLKHAKLPVLSRCYLRLGPDKVFKTCAHAIAALAALEDPWTGWCRRESNVGPWTVESRGDTGVPLDGEWAHSDGNTSRALRYSGGVWHLSEVAEDPNGSVEALRENVELAGVDGGRLRYAIYWSCDASGSRQIACRFLGFVRMGDKS